MAHWTESSWTVFASADKESLQFKQTLPFALIGSGAHCHLRLPVQEELKTVYLACNFDDRIEVWPLCATAFPAWGIIPPTVEVLVGHYRLRFEKYSKNFDQQVLWGSAAETECRSRASQMASDMELTMAWEGKSVTKVIARSVTILGSQHPSVWRTRGRHMRPCDHAIICERDRMWLVDLNPQHRRLENPAIYELQENGEYYQVGDMRLSLGPATIESDASVKARRDRQPQSHCASINGPTGMKSTVPTEIRSATPPPKTVSLPQPAAQHPPVAAVQLARAGNHLSPSGTHGVLEGLDCPEMLTSRLTGRLVSINQRSRFTRGKLIRIGASTITFVAASVFLIWLFH